MCIDVLVNNAGIHFIKDITDVTAEDFDKCMGINLKSTFLYNIIKAGALQMAKSLATRYAADGIRVNAVCPGATRTGQITEEHTQSLVSMDDFWTGAGEAHPMQRHAMPEEIANAILFLASDESSFVTGAPLIVDGGYLAR